MTLPAVLGFLLLGPALLAVTVVDWRSYRIPDALSLPLLAAGLAFATVFSGLPFADHGVGAAVGFGFPALFGEVYFRMRGRDGLGLGDAKLLGAAGAWLGWAALPFVVLIAALAGLCLALGMGHRDAAARVPFGPALALAIAVVWIWGTPYQGPLWR